MSRSIGTSNPRKHQEIPEGYAIDPSVGPTYAFQRSLPHLPVPTIESTTEKYLETVRPHLTSKEYTETKKAAEEFSHSDIVKTLQERLLARAKVVTNHPNWLAEWWNEAAYMGYRGEDHEEIISPYIQSSNAQNLRQTPSLSMSPTTSSTLMTSTEGLPKSELHHSSKRCSLSGNW
jgi:carnitine O-acetyltransferase